MLLEIKNLYVKYGNVEVLHGINIAVDEGEVVTILGANGAGKSTTLLAISGLVKPSQGEIFFDGKPLHKLHAHQVVHAGISQSPEGRRVFGTLTVQENINLGAFIVRDKEKIAQTRKWIYELFPRLEERKNQLAGTLSGGEQQMLAIARGLMANPKLILLDEPSMGLAPILVEQVFDVIENNNKQGTSILLVEQNAQMALSIADRAYVLETGRIVLEGAAQDLIKNQMVIDAYLGG